MRRRVAGQLEQEPPHEPAVLVGEAAGALQDRAQLARVEQRRLLRQQTEPREGQQLRQVRPALQQRRAMKVRLRLRRAAAIPPPSGKASGTVLREPPRALRRRPARHRLALPSLPPLWCPPLWCPPLWCPPLWCPPLPVPP